MLILKACLEAKGFLRTLPPSPRSQPKKANVYDPDAHSKQEIHQAEGEACAPRAGTHGTAPHRHTAIQGGLAGYPAPRASLGPTARGVGGEDVTSTYPASATGREMHDKT
eukprot:7383326-Prymnesium_polylepis.4